MSSCRLCSGTFLFLRFTLKNNDNWQDDASCSFNPRIYCLNSYYMLYKSMLVWPFNMKQMWLSFKNTSTDGTINSVCLVVQETHTHTHTHAGIRGVKYSGRRLLIWFGNVGCWDKASTSPMGNDPNGNITYMWRSFIWNHDTMTCLQIKLL